MCVVTIDFKEAFDKIPHSYLFAILKEYGFSDQFQQCVRRTYENAASTIQINGYQAGPKPMRSSVHQGCPMSMLLYALCLNPLLCTLENKLTGLRITQCAPKTTVVAYADDVTIFVTKHNNIQVIQEALRCFEAASGAQVNIQKWKAVEFGPWDTSVTVMDIPYHTETKILGFHVMSTANASAIKSWYTMTNVIRGQARDA
jgi:urease beta subunit